MVLFYSRQIADLLQALVVLVVRAVAVLMRRGSGASGASGRAGPGSNVKRQKIGLLLVSLLLALQAAPGGTTSQSSSDITSKLEAAGSCGHTLLSVFANCGSADSVSMAGNSRTDVPAPSLAQTQGLALENGAATAVPNCSVEHPEAGSVCWAAMWGGQ